MPPQSSSPCPGRRASAVPARQRRGCRPVVERLDARQLLSGDMVLRWNEMGMEAAKVDHSLNYPTEQFGPTRTSRAMAIESIAIYDAVAAVDGTYQPYLTHVIAPPNTSMDAAVAQAGHDALAALYPHQKPMFDAALAADLAAIPAGPAKWEGVVLGHITAANILFARRNDGSQRDAVGQPINYTYGTAPGDWQPDPLHPNANPLTPDWGSVRPFVLTSGDQFRLPPPPALNSPEYAAAFNEVKALGGSSPTSPTTRTDEQTTIGLFWGYDAQPGLCAPVRLYDQITDTICRQQGNTEVQNARLFLLVNVAMADAGIACWGDKYFYNFWRPVTAIREGNLDGNPLTTADPAWTPLGAPADNRNGVNFTPPFPSYPSGHADFGGALFTILKDFYGTDNFHFTIISDEFNTITVDQNGNPRPLTPRSFDSFSQAMVENGMSRIYLGIHFSFDMNAGIKQGTEIGDYVFAHIGLSRMKPGEEYVNKVYRDMTGTRPAPAMLSALSADLARGGSRDSVMRAIEGTDAYRASVVTTEFAQLFDRAPSARELQSDTAFLKQGGTKEGLQARLMGTREYLMRRGGGTVNGFLSAVATDLAGRPLPAALQGTLGQRLRAGASRQAVVRSVQQLPSTCQNVVQDLYRLYLRRAPDLAGSKAATDALRAGASPERVARALMASAEYASHV